MAAKTLPRACARAAGHARSRLAEDVERMCADAGMSLRALAWASGVPHSYLARIMSGRARPSMETYAKLAIPLGADLVARLYPNTGPTVRDRHQARILEHLLSIVTPRWRPSTEVAITKPARGWIDVVFADDRATTLVATEIESDLRRIEQTVRWSREKADSLPSWPGWVALAWDRPATISQLLVVRRTRSNQRMAQEFARQLATDYPAHPADAIAALTGSAAWPGAALVWVIIEPGRVRLLPSR